MNTETCCARHVPEGLVSLIIPSKDEDLHAALATPSAQRLVDRGAGLWLTRDGTYVLSITRPTNAFAKAICVRDLHPDTTPCEVNPCVA
jgi:hypothetical protein